MKKLIIASAILSLSTLAQADNVRLINGDGSDLSEMCIAAVESPVQISPLDKRDTLCNDMPMSRFVQKMRSEIALRQTTYVFSVEEENELTTLCMAAIESEDAYRSVKQELFGNAVGLESEVMCNGLPIKAFARKYRNRMTTTSL